MTAGWTFPIKEAESRKTLDPLGCATPNCDHDHSVLYLCQKCHPKAGLDVKYIKATGVLKMECKECEAPVAEIQVAD